MQIILIKKQAGAELSQAQASFPARFESFVWNEV